MLGSEYLVTQAVLPSYQYRFQIRAQNKWGWGEWSAVTTVTASTWPEIVGEPVTLIDSTNGNVIVSWPETNARGSVITQYLIELGDAVDSNVWVTNTANCNG